MMNFTRTFIPSLSSIDTREFVSYIAAKTTVLVESSNSVLKRVIDQLEAIGTKSIRIILLEETMSLCRWRY